MSYRPTDFYDLSCSAKINNPLQLFQNYLFFYDYVIKLVENSYLNSKMILAGLPHTMSEYHLIKKVYRLIIPAAI